MRNAFSKTLAGTTIVLALAALTATAQSASPTQPANAGAEAAPATNLTVVETKEVCMVNDRFFGQDQIPVEVEGKTYYGCCEGCKKRLAEDAGIRHAVDPVSGETVDKATAIIAARPDGSVLYFSSQENLDQYLK